MKELAAHGYIVVDMFHGDGRGDSIAANMALRGIEMRATVDYLLQHPDFAPAIDPAQIGAVGESAGGYTVLAALGGIDPARRIPGAADPRIKAAFGLIPSMGDGIDFWLFKVDFWYFGEDYAGLRGVQRPFFAVYGEKDRDSSPKCVEAGIREMTGPTTAVMLDGETHALSSCEQRHSHTGGPVLRRVAA